LNTSSSTIPVWEWNGLDIASCSSSRTSFHPVCRQNGTGGPSVPLLFLCGTSFFLGCSGSFGLPSIRRIRLHFDKDLVICVGETKLISAVYLWMNIKLLTWAATLAIYYVTIITAIYSIYLNWALYTKWFPDSIHEEKELSWCWC
jgi:hypothetical protein